MEPCAVIRLSAGRDRSLRAGHPWLYSGAVARIDGDPTPGGLADVEDHRGEFIARGYLNPSSQIVFRALSRLREPLDHDFFVRRIGAALAARAGWVEGCDGFRVVHGEGDLLPGLVLDRYGDVVVVQLMTAGMERRREMVLDAVEQACRPVTIWERSDGPGRRLEGLPVHRGLARGVEPPPEVVIVERGVRYRVDLRGGQKTGFYLDQREARGRVGRLARDARVLDMFANTGGFSVAAVVGGAAAVTAVDVSASNLALIGHQLEENGRPAAAVQCVVEDAFEFLRRTTGEFELIVLDPPAFAKRKAEVRGACRGYKDIHLQALRLLAEGGVLVTSSCSHHIDRKLFQQIVHGAAVDAGRELQILERIGQPADHPVSLNHPEGDYLKTLVLRAVGC